MACTVHKWEPPLHPHDIWGGYQYCNDKNLGENIVLNYKHCITRSKSKLRWHAWNHFVFQNYNKSRIHSYRGVKDVRITLDEVVIFVGEIARASGGVFGNMNSFGDVSFRMFTVVQPQSFWRKLSYLMVHSIILPGTYCHLKYEL